MRHAISAVVVVAWILVLGWTLGAALTVIFPIHPTPPAQPYP